MHVRSAAAAGMLAVICLANAVQAQQCTIDPAASSVSIAQPAVIFACPAGDGPTLTSVGATLTAHLVDQSGTPCTAGLFQGFEVDGNPPSDIWDGVQLPGVQFDVSGANFVNLGNGDYEVGGALYAGGVSAGGAIVKYIGITIGGSPIPLQITSADLNGDGVVNLADASVYAANLGGPYDFRFDYNGDGVINLSDVSIFASHLGHTLPPFWAVDPVD